MPTPNPIIGNTSIRIGDTTTFSNTTADGVWSSADASIATIDSDGIATGVSVGSTSIIYTVGSDSIAVTLNIYQQTISNGFDLAQIMPAFQGRLGWHQPTYSGAPVLSTANKTATSGRYYDRGFHPAVTIKNYVNNQEDAGITDDQLNQLLQDDDQAVITRCINAIFNRPQLIEHRLCYTRVMNVLNIAVPNGDNFVGYRLNISPGNFAVNLDNISLYFNGVATFNIYLFNDLVLLPIKSKEVTTVANSQTKVNLDWTINYIGDNLGGVYYIGYFQKDLGTVQALDEQLNLWDGSLIFGGVPFQGARFGDLDFYRKNPSVVFRSYGLNVEISSYRDYTQLIVQNPHLFDEARGLCMAIARLEQQMYSTRSNEDERITRENAVKLNADVNLAFPTQDFPFVAGLKKQLEREFKRLNDNFSQKAEPVSVSISGDQGVNYLGYDTRQLPPRQTFA
jgi:hypothetical protein